ncbi:GCR1-C domain-containing protein [Fusarium sp. LHS14.1]|nr:GCR1-C domain-containing protein [Fusarium sp. LHS14.1]
MTNLIDPALYLLPPSNEAHPTNAAPMLLSPDPSPESSAVDRPVSEDPHRLPAPAACSRSIDPILDPPSLELDPDPLSADEDGDIRGKHIDDAVNQVPLSLARVVINIQEHYASELEAERQKTDELIVQNERMKQKMNEMEKRIEMHVIIMDGFVGFMRDVKEGRFAVGEKAAPTELAIAKQLGCEHAEEVEILASQARRNPRLAHPREERLRLNEESWPTYDEDLQEEESLTLEATTARTTSQWVEAAEDSFDQLPPTPDMDTAPVRSTGRRAPRRRNLPLRTRRRAKRRLRATLQRSPRLGEAPTWTAINATDSNQATEQSSTPNPHLGAILEQEEDDGDFQDEPALDDYAEDERSTLIASRSSSPFSSAESPPLMENYKPRYSVPRSVGYRYATGPPGRRFKYHRMPKTVALVWTEWKHGLHGNPAIEELERNHGTTWRLGTLQERKYASNYVGVRQKIVRKVEEMCQEGAIGVEEACWRLDERVDGRMQLLMAALRKGEDPLEVIPIRRKNGAR